MAELKLNLLTKYNKNKQEQRKQENNTNIQEGTRNTVIINIFKKRNKDK